MTQSACAFSAHCLENPHEQGAFSRFDFHFKFHIEKAEALSRRQTVAVEMNVPANWQNTETNKKAPSGRLLLQVLFQVIHLVGIPKADAA